MVKSTKLYFTDTGLACYLLGIHTATQLRKDSSYGNLFENWVVAELRKARYNQGLDPRLYFYRDVTGKEVDLLYQKGSSLIPIEIKSSQTFSPSFLKGGFVIYGGKQTQKIGKFQLLNAENCTQFLSMREPKS